ncbi:MAG: PAS domain S-box protein [Balneolaceae bacterium]|nr:PAS domain S-box protein [Balneolaceae bacterium]
MKVDPEYFENCQNPAIVIDAETLEILHFNPSFLTFTKLNNSEILGLYFPDLLNDAEFNNHRSFTDHLLYPKDDKVFFMNTRRTNVRPVKLSGLKINISGKEALLITIQKIYDTPAGIGTNTPESYSRKYHSNGSSQLFFLLTADGQFLDWNSELEKVTGYSSQEISSMKPADFFRKEIHPVVHQKIEEVLSNGQADLRAPLLSKSQSDIDYHFFARKVKIDKKPHLMGFAVDVSEQKKASMENHFRERFYKKLVNSTDIIIYAKDKTGSYKFINKAFKKLIRNKELDSSNLKDQDIFYDEELSPIRNGDLKVLETKQPIVQEEVVEIAGEKRYFQTLKTPTLAPNGRDFWVVGLATNITKNKKSQKSLKKSLEERNILLQEIHHRVNNNLEIINALIYLQFQDVNNKQLKNELKYFQSRIRSIAAVHKIMYDFKSLVNVDLKKIIKHLIDQTFKTLKPLHYIQFKFKVEEIKLNANQAIPCTLVINEFLTDALFQAKSNKKRGKIFLNVSEKDNNVTVNFFIEGFKLSDKIISPSKSGKQSKLFDVFLKQLNASFNSNITKTESSFSLSFRKQEINGSAANLLTYD